MKKPLENLNQINTQGTLWPMQMGFFATKLRNRMGDKTLDGLITMRQFYKKPRKFVDSDSDDE